MNEHQAELLERRAFLLRSLDDLDREHAAGDLSEADYSLLHDDYSRRAAEVLREIESGRPPTSTGPRSNPLRGWIVVGGVGLFAVLAGILVTQVAGERTGTDGLTGTVQTAAANSSDAKVQALLTQGRAALGSDPLVALQSFDEAAKLDPTQVEALAYGGWVLRLVARSVDDATKREELLAGAERRLNDAIARNPRYPDARAFRGVLLLRDRDDPKAALVDFVALEQLDPPDEIVQLVGSARQDAEDAVAASTAG